MIYSPSTTNSMITYSSSLPQNCLNKSHLNWNQCLKYICISYSQTQEIETQLHTYVTYNFGIDNTISCLKNKSIFAYPRSNRLYGYLTNYRKCFRNKNASTAAAAFPHKVGIFDVYLRLCTNQVLRTICRSR